ncbi:cobyrinate a,c-diamide synthase [Paenibacillus mucilaginosus]|uniref:Cobyrinate a,c-diamide synthase n=1 Tax=Paenibacillus mucilaginosus (strain KNP414) TaxID=1036673 RepID=F8FEM8_PAEMK|nr:cobyrinate a,c-diamide synthase [Paenibacillus mucilaginosus]AEI45345.1 CobB [Paenibacillus mucilaginosus KNP414]MCG7212774.1 cobyrinate a,c-diamide synthase [Paenibacillus mucilaginosus]WDM26800.1 cobyrinate a,c-diamide synthase [Paenibacillus mucilaginosus]
MSERKGRPGLIIAGTGSGAGKTTVTIGLMAALQRRGLRVQGFKCGPDYIDPTYHRAVTGRASRNLDSWMLSSEGVREIYRRAGADADISIIEGVMGFYDGKEATSNRGSTAEISLELGVPVLLVVNCQSMARSCAAIVKGFQLLDPRVRIAAVFANKVGSEGHYRIVKDAVEAECGIPVIGYMTRQEELALPERHLGLVPSIERGDLNAFFDLLADRMEANVGLGRLLELAAGSDPLPEEEPRLFAPPAKTYPVKLAVAYDAAFHFYYPENLELLELHGAELAYFSPLAGEPLPEGAQGLYLGGGFPEEFAERLSRQTDTAESIRRAVRQGLPTLAECGGYMYLTESITGTDGETHPMLGLVPGRVTMQRKLAALGLREVKGAEGNFLFEGGLTARGHEFHYSAYELPEGAAQLPPAYETSGLRGTKPEGGLLYSVVAGYTHLHFGSQPKLVERWLQRCAAFEPAVPAQGEPSAG